MTPLGLMRRAWSPIGEPWLMALFDMSNAASLTIDGSSRLEAANDLSGNGRHATQTNAAERLPYSASDTRVNNQPAVGAADGSSAVGLEVPSAGYRRLYIVGQILTGVETTIPAYSTLYTQVSASSENDRLHIFQDLQWTTSSGTPNVPRVGGVVPATTALPLPLSVITSDLTSGTRGIYFGGNDFRQDRSWGGPLLFLALTAGTESVANRDKLEGFAAHRFGAAATLTASHPYKSSPP